MWDIATADSSREVAEGIAACRGLAPNRWCRRRFKVEEYANLIGGRQYERTRKIRSVPRRLALYGPRGQACFELECARSRVSETWDSRTSRSCPLVARSTRAARRRVIAGNGLRRGTDGLKIIMMRELPTNAARAHLSSITTACRSARTTDPARAQGSIAIGDRRGS